jgi:hypothetical protein
VSFEILGIPKFIVYDYIAIQRAVNANVSQLAVGETFWHSGGIQEGCRVRLCRWRLWQMSKTRVISAVKLVAGILFIILAAQLALWSAGYVLAIYMGTMTTETTVHQVLLAMLVPAVLAIMAVGFFWSGLRLARSARSN